MTQWVIRIRESLARKIALQLTQGLAYFHSEGICHGNPTNRDILFQLTNFDAWSQEKVYEQLGTPMVVGLDEWSRSPSVPRYLVDSAQFFRASPGLLAESIRIIDYWDSFRVGWPTPSSIDQGNRVSGFSPPRRYTWAQNCAIFRSLGSWLHHLRNTLWTFPLSYSYPVTTFGYALVDWARTWQPPLRPAKPLAWWRCVFGM